jgi:outer membrane protein OmpA-like peptidoglycan-associated protein
MRILVQVVDAIGVEARGASLYAVHLVAFLEQKFSQVGAILAGYARDQCGLAQVPVLVFVPNSAKFTSTFNPADRNRCTMFAAGLSPWVAPVKMTIYLAVICGAAALSSTGPARAGATDPDPPPQANAAATGDFHPVRIAPLTAQEAALRTTLAHTAVVISRSGKALELWYPVRLAFVPDGTELLASVTAMLDLLARSLREYERTAVVVVVYTDAIGSNNYNQQQSQTRAAAVVAYLESKGVSPARLAAKGAGESAPLEAPNTPEGRDLNRRLQVVITPLS